MSFFDAEAKSLVTDAVKRAESKTSGEVVVIVRPSSDGYRHATVVAGLITATAVLCVFLYHPQPFDFTYLPLELAAAFVIGAVVSLGFPTIRRALVSRADMKRAVRRAACEAFVERGVHRTRGRTGVLVCVSVFERRVELVTDVGVDTRAFEREWSAAKEALEVAVRRHDPKAFASGIVALGDALEAALPRAADDENELPDAPEEVA